MRNDYHQFGRVRYLRLLLTGVVVALIGLGLAPAGASSANISHPYETSGSIPNGSLVSLSAGHTNYVELANTNNGDRLLGVASNDSLIAVDAGKGQIQVATSGNATVLVSTLDGNINVGDQVAVSPFNGIGMKALPGARVIGLAQTAFNPSSPGATSEQVKDKNGNVSTVQVGYIQVSIAIGSESSYFGLSSLQRFAKSITGQTVSTFRVAASLVILAVALIALAALVYASIYGGIIAVGRNPLAKNAVFRSLSKVLVMAVVTAVISGATIFFLLQ